MLFDYAKKSVQRLIFEKFAAYLMTEDVFYKLIKEINKRSRLFDNLFSFVKYAGKQLLQKLFTVYC